MIPVDEALAIIQREIQPLPAVKMPFNEAQGLVLAEDIVADEPMPPFAAASVDGYAVVAADGPGPRQVIGDQTAGHMAGLHIDPGTAARVMTGAPIPPGADAMVMIEDTEENDSIVNIFAQNIETGGYIRPVGEDIAAGQLVLAQATVLGPAELGLLGTVGKTQVSVHRRPVVAVMSTGNEIVPPHEKPGQGQIRDSNRYTLIGAAQQAGATTLDLGIVSDEAGHLEEIIERGLAEADVLVTSGGVSMGQLDLVKPYLASRGTIHFGRVRTKPGKPVTFATVDGKSCFAMPGFPVSALVSFEIFARPALLKMAGHANIYRPRESAILAHDIKHDPGRTEFQRVILTRRSDKMLEASTTGFQGSGRLLSMVGANGLIRLPEGQADFEAGAMVEAMIIGAIENTL
jgi:molybdenum cofactor synthesis domain-containing protein